MLSEYWPQYTYKVRSANSAWSAEFTFRSIRPASEGTRLASYGDMGVSPYNNMQNLLDDCQSGTIDVFLHVSHFRSCDVYLADHRNRRNS